MTSPMDLLIPMHRQIGAMITRGVVSATSDGSQRQMLQVKIGENEFTQNVEHFQPYGFTSHALAGAAAIVASIGGNAENRVVLAVSDRRSRPKVAAGEVVMFDDQGQLVAIRRGRIEVAPKSGNTIALSPGTGTAGVARMGDDVGIAGNPTVDGTMAKWIAVVTAAVNGLAPGSCIPPTDFGVITRGSGTVTAGD